VLISFFFALKARLPGVKL